MSGSEASSYESTGTSPSIRKRRGGGGSSSGSKPSGPSPSTRSDNNPSFPCPVCFKCFSSGQALGGHQNAHRHERKQFEAAFPDSGAAAAASFGYMLPGPWSMHPPEMAGMRMEAAARAARVPPPSDAYAHAHAHAHATTGTGVAQLGQGGGGRFEPIGPRGYGPAHFGFQAGSPDLGHPQPSYDGFHQRVEDNAEGEGNLDLELRLGTGRG